MTLTTLQHLGQAFDAGDVDVCATCDQIVCSHSDADYQGWAEPDAITPTTAAEIRRRRKVFGESDVYLARAFKVSVGAVRGLLGEGR